MSTTISLTTTEQNTILDSLSDRMDSGKLRIYAGTVPADADAALSGNTLLAECTLSATSFNAAASGSMTANTVTGDTSNNASGTATFYRVIDNASPEAVVVQGTVGTTGSGASMTLSDVNIVAGGTFDVDSWTIGF